MFFANRKKQLWDGLDNLCQRITEAEHSQMQLETIYETARSLAGLHSPDEVLDETLNIAHGVLGFPACAVLLLNAREDHLLLKATMVPGEKQIYENPPVVALDGMLKQVVTTHEAYQMSHAGTHPRTVTGLPQLRSQMLVPMTARESVIGLFVAESQEDGVFLDRVHKLSSILANTAAMALENAVMHKMMEEMAIKDPLTGVFNYRYFQTKLLDELKHSKHYRQPLSLMIIDLDNFKKTNESFGHQAGNLVLRGVVEAIQKCIRPTDILTRYDSHDFAVILPQTDKRDSYIIGERVRSMVAETRFGRFEEFPEMRVTVSVGITTYPENGYGEQAIIKVADQALHRAKGSGRNLLCAI